MESWQMVVDLVGRHAGSWTYIQRSTCNHENEEKTINPGWILYSVYAVLGVNSSSWHGEIERDDLTLWSVMMVQLWTRRRDGGWRWEQRREDELIWDIRQTTCLIEMRRPRIAVMTGGISICTRRFGDGKLTSTCNFLKSQFLMMICPISSHLSLSRPRFYHHLSTRSSLIPLCVSMPWSRVNTKCSIHQIHHTPSTAYTDHTIHRVQHTLSTAYSE